MYEDVQLISTHTRVKPRQKPKILIIIPAKQIPGHRRFMETDSGALFPDTDAPRADSCGKVILRAIIWRMPSTSGRVCPT